MPLSVEIAPDPSLIVIRCFGRFTDDDLLDIPAAVMKHEHFAAGLPSLTDLTEVTESGLTTEGNRRYIALLKNSRQRRGAARAAVLAANDVHFGMARMLQTLAGDGHHLRYRVFRDRDEAMRWVLEAEAD